MKGSKRDDTALINGVMERTANKYSAVIVASKRARRLNEGAKAVVKSNAAKPTTVAMEEIAAGKIVSGPALPGLKKAEIEEGESLLSSDSDSPAIGTIETAIIDKSDDDSAKDEKDK